MCSSTSYWAWNSSSSLDLFWCSYPPKIYSCLENICGLESDWGDINFSFCLWWWCCFLSNFATYWRIILPLIAISSCLFYFLCKVSLSSSSLDWDIITILMVVLTSSYFSFLGGMCVGSKGLLCFINLSFRLSFLTLSSYGYAYFFFSRGFTPIGNQFWKIISSTMAKWHTSFFGFLLVVPSIIFFWHFSHLVNYLNNWKNIIATQLIDFPQFSLKIIIAYLLLKYCTLSF